MGMMLIGMAMEVMGVGMVIPALALMTQGDLASRHPEVVPWLNRIGNPSHERLVAAGMLILVGAYAVKMLFLAFLAWWQSHFAYALQSNISQRLFAGYLRQPYVFHVQRNSAQLIRNTMSQPSELTNVVQNVLNLITEVLVLLGISVLLLAVEPFGALLVVSTLGLAGWLFHHLTRQHILRWGEARQLHEGLRIQRLQEGLGGAKDVKLLGREDDFLAQYRLNVDSSCRAGQRQSALQAMPRLWLELLAVVGLAALVIVMIGRGRALDAILPTLGLFAAAAYRVMPSANRVIGAIQNVRFSLPVIDNLYSELCLLNATQSRLRDQFPPFKNALALNEVSFQYSTADGPALRNVSLSIPRGASIGFIGGSGAGKSTLVDIILGLLSPDTGTIKVDGADIRDHLRGWQDQIGYVPQSIFLTDDTLRRNVAFGLSNEQIDDAAVWRAIRAAQLDQFVNELPQGLETMVGERGVRLSGGERQRIGIARALYHDPAVLVLDEATSSLDIVTERGVMDAVRALQGEKTILIVAHRLSTVENCNRLFRLDQGRVVEEGETATVLRNIASLPASAAQYSASTR